MTSQAANAVTPVGSTGSAVPMSTPWLTPKFLRIDYGHLGAFGIHP